jgi:hypothetical protein
MRTLLLGLLAIATAVTADTVVSSTGSLHHPAGKPTVVTGSGYRFYDRFCRNQYNNATDRNACMMKATGVTLSTSERDDR